MTVDVKVPRRSPIKPGAPAESTWRVYDFIAEQMAARRRFPSDAAIAKHMGWRDPSNVKTVLDRLVVWGKLRRFTIPLELRQGGMRARRIGYELTEGQ